MLIREMANPRQFEGSTYILMCFKAGLIRRKGAKFPLAMLMQSYRVHSISDEIYEHKLREYGFSARVNS